MANQTREFKGQVLGTSTTTGESRKIKTTDDGVLQVEMTNADIQVDVQVEDIISVEQDDKTKLLGTMAIDQTTDGTTNKVQARNATHDNLNANANLQVADTDVGNANPVPVDVRTIQAGSDVIGKVSIDQTTDGTTNKVRTLDIPNSTLIQGNITLNGSAQQLHADTACKNVTIQAHPANSNYVYVGNASVSASVHMFVLDGGSSITLTVNNLNLLYVLGTSTEKVSYGGEV